MAKLIVKTRFATVPNYLLNDAELSFKAKGLYGYIQSKPDEWEFSAERIAASSKDGLDSVKAGLVELEKAGYLQRIRYQDQSGFWRVDYILHENPAVENPTQENPTLDYPTLEKPPTYSKKEESKKEVSKKDNNKAFSFYDSLLAIAGEECEPLVKDFMLVRKTKKATNTQTAFNLFVNEWKKSGLHIADILTTCILRDWKSFKADWLNPQKPTFQQIMPQKPKSTAQDILSERNIV